VLEASISVLKEKEKKKKSWEGDVMEVIKIKN
jgi:hypothetical protein